MMMKSAYFMIDGWFCLGMRVINRLETRFNRYA